MKLIIGPFKVEREDGKVEDISLEVQRVVGNHAPFYVVTREIKNPPAYYRYLVA